MEREEIRRGFLELEAAHRTDRDGGDELARDMLRALRGLDEPGRRAAREQLMEWVDREEGRMWGVALDTLVGERAAGTAHELEARLRSGGHGIAWRDQLVLALMRMRHAPALELYVEHIEAGVREERPFALSLLQHLYAFDAARALELSARYFGKRLPGAAEDLGGLVQSQLVALAELGGSLLPELVRRTSVINAPAGARLAGMMSEYLDMPWLRDRLGAPEAARLQESLAAA